MKVVVINRLQDIDRRESIEQKLLALRVEYSFFTAVEGARLQDAGYQINPGISYDRKMAIQICGRELTPPEMGCSLSHLMIYGQMLESNEECVCILEDDALMGPNFTRVLDQIEQEPVLEMVLLGHFSRKEWDYEVGAETTRIGRVELLPEVFASKPVEFPLATCAYVVKRSAARRLLEFGTPLRLPPDWLTGSAEALGINLFVVTPPAVVVEPELHRKSTIGDRMGGRKAAIDREVGLKKLTAIGMHYAKTIFRAVCRIAGKIGVARTSYVWIFNRNGLAKYPGHSRNKKLET